MTDSTNLQPRQSSGSRSGALTEPAEPGRSGIRAFVGRRPLAVFLVLSCVFAWWPIPLYAAGWSPTIQAGFGPFVAAVLVLSLTEGRPGVRRLWRSMLAWRVPPRAYLAAIGIPVVISVVAILANLALGAPAPSASDVALWTQIPVTILAVLLIPGLGGAWEEPGFRGFALGRFEQRFGMIAAPLVLGVFWAFWHLPLFLVGDILYPDVVVIIAASVVIAAVFHSARESVLIAMLLHATNNAVGGGYASQLFHGSDATRLNQLVAAAWVLVAAAVIARQRSRSSAKTVTIPVRSSAHTAAR